MIRRLTVLAAVIGGLSLGVASPAEAQTKCEPVLGRPPLARKGVLIAAINPTVAPIQYIDDDGNIIGLDPDLGNAIAKRLCLTMQLQSTQFATMIPLLKEGRGRYGQLFHVLYAGAREPGVDGPVRCLVRRYRRADSEQR